MTTSAMSSTSTAAPAPRTMGDASACWTRGDVSASCTSSASDRSRHALAANPTDDDPRPASDTDTTWETPGSGMVTP